MWPEFYPIEHGFDEMKHFGAYYPGVYTYADTNNDFHPWFPSYNQKFSEEYFKIVNMYEWEGVAGQPAKKGAYITWDYLAEFDVRQTDSAVDYIKKHAKDDKPFFMDVNFMKMHNPNNPAKAFLGKSQSRVATRIRCWNSTPTSAGSWMRSAPRHPTRSSS